MTRRQTGISKEARLAAWDRADRLCEAFATLLGKDELGAEKIMFEVSPKGTVRISLREEDALALLALAGGEVQR